MSSAQNPVVETSWEPLRLTHLKPSFNNHELALAARQEPWHKFIIFSAGNYDPRIVMDSVIFATKPEVLLPVNYEVDQTGKGTFLVKCSVTAIETLVRQRLQIPLVCIEQNNVILKMDIVLGFISINKLQINPHKIISDALITRWDSLKKTLNLENFETDSHLGRLYCPLSAPAIFVFVLKCCKMRTNNKIPIRELNLRNNKLPGVMLYEKLFNYSLTKLDMSHNKIENIEYLRYFSEFKIVELWLNGNPLCSNYKTPEEYIYAVKQVFPHLQQLDGVIIGVNQKFSIPPTQNFFLPDDSRLSLVKQFISHYFTIFDQKDRDILNGVYAADALFSVTIGPIANPRHRQLTKLSSINRNLLKVVDYSRFHKYLLQGPDEIIATLRKLPPTYHNFKDFSIDILHQGIHHLAFSVQGSFYYREFPISLGFNRTFVIVEEEDNEWRITNDQYHILSSNSSMMENFDVKLRLETISKFTPTILGENEKDDLLKFLCNISTMNEAFSRRFLVKYKWDLRAAISAFAKAYSLNDVPPEAFRQKRQEEK